MNLVSAADFLSWAADRRIEIPGRRNGRTGSLARGFFVWNSEVGDTTLGVEFFLFDGEVGFQFCEFLCMFLDFFRVIGYPTRCFGKRMFTLQ